MPEDTVFARKTASNEAAASPQMLIHGRLDDGTDVTLQECYVAHIQYRGAAPETSWYVSTIYLGRQLPDPDAPILAEFRMGFPHLLAWAETDGLSAKSAATTADQGGGYLVKTPVGSHTLLDSHALRVQVCYGTGQRWTQDELTFTMSAELIAQVLNGPVTLMEGLDRIIYPLEAFFSFCVGVPMAYSSVSARLWPGDPTGVPSIHDEVEILTLRQLPRRTSGSVYPFEMRLPRSLLTACAADALEKWMQAFARFRPTFDSYFAVQFSTDMFLQAQLLNLAQALESYHRRAYDGAYMTKDEYAPVLQDLKNAIPSSVTRDFRDSLKGRLRYLNEFSLRKRLADFVDRFSIALRGILPDRTGFCSAVADTRNYLTHHEKTEDQNVKEGLQLLRLVQKLRLVVEMAMLREIGLSDEAIRGLFSRPPWNHLVHSPKWYD